MAGIPTFRDLIRSANPGPQVGTNWSKANVHGRPDITPTLTPNVTFYLHLQLLLHLLVPIPKQIPLHRQLPEL